MSNNCKWPQGHDLCPDWGKDYLKIVLSDPETMIPVKWQMWKLAMSPITVEMQLDPAQLEMYLMYSAIKEVANNEKVMGCPYCKYFEVWLCTSSSNFFYCHGSEWKKVSCSICHKETFVPKKIYSHNYF